MSNRHIAALNIGTVTNIHMVVAVLRSAIEEMAAESNSATCMDPAVRLIVAHLADLCGVDHMSPARHNNCVALCKVRGAGP